MSGDKTRAKFPLLFQVLERESVGSLGTRQKENSKYQYDVSRGTVDARKESWVQEGLCYLLFIRISLCLFVCLFALGSLLEIPVPKDGVPSSLDLLGLATHVNRNWRHLGLALGLSDSSLDIIEADKTGVVNRCYFMLLQWTQENGSNATFHQLADALKHRSIQRADLAVQHCCRMVRQLSEP